MQKLLVFFASLLFSGALCASEVGSYPNATTLAGAERLLADQSSNSVNITPTQIAAYVQSYFASNPLNLATSVTGNLPVTNLPSIATNTVLGNFTGSPGIASANPAVLLSSGNALGLVYFSSSTALASSAALANGQLIEGSSSGPVSVGAYLPGAMGGIGGPLNPIATTNTGIGNGNLAHLTTGINETAYGSGACAQLTNVNGTSCFGQGSGTWMQTSANSSTFGAGACQGTGTTPTTGNNNTCFGASSGVNCQGTCGNNTFIGENSGSNLTTGTNNAIIGVNCTFSSATATEEFDLCAGIGGTLFQITGGGTPSTSIATLYGSLTLPALTTGTNADFVCITSGKVLVIQASACTISSQRFKTNIQLLEDADPILSLNVHTYQMKEGDTPNADANYTHPQIGLIAEEVAASIPACAVYEQDMVTPKSYRPECITALLVKVAQDHQKILTRDQIEIYILALWCLLMTTYLVVRRRV